MIERWFPCTEVSAASGAGWGSGTAESSLWVWFAKRPVAQSKAAVLCSLLSWPDDETEQRQRIDLVRRALTGYGEAQDEIRALLSSEYNSARVLDPFSGRGMIPLEVGRLGCEAHAIDYSPLAALGSKLLADYIHRDWNAEPSVPFTDPAMRMAEPKLVADTRAFLQRVGESHRASLECVYPRHQGGFPWGYLWASTLPCQECGVRFPLVGELVLRLPRPKQGDEGQSLELVVDKASGVVTARVHDGAPKGTPTRILAGKSKYSSSGRVAVCPFCRHVHLKAEHTRLSVAGQRRDQLLVAADIAPDGTKVFRSPTPEELVAPHDAEQLLASEPRFGVMSAVPDEEIPPGNTWTIQSVNYGDKTYGDLMEARQTLNFIRLARAINQTTSDARAHGLSDDYVTALASIAAAAMMRKIRRSTRGARLQITGGARVGDLFVNQSAVSFSYDWFESALSDGPGSWDSLAGQTVTTVRNLIQRAPVRSATAERGDATALRFRSGTFDAVVTDPPYDDMIDYSDSSDLFFVWAKRAMHEAMPEFAITGRPDGLQDKDRELIVKRGGTTATADDPRTRDHYDRLVAQAFAEARRVVTSDGIVTIVFGHGDPEVWQRLLAAIQAAGLVLTGSWPAKTEAGGSSAATNIVTTLTMACRPAPQGRPEGRRGGVEAEIRQVIRERYPDWELWGLAPADMLMAAAGPAMEVVGGYSVVLDSRGEPVDIHTFLPLARAAVQEAMAVSIDNRPLDTFDARTKFALWWARLYGRQAQAKSELRWQTLASSLDLDTVRDLVVGDKAVSLVTSARFKSRITPDSAAIDVVLALAAASEDGLAAMGRVLAASQFAYDDQCLWATIHFLADRLPDSDPDSVTFHRVLRARAGIGSAAQNLVDEVRSERRRQDLEDRQITLL